MNKWVTLKYPAIFEVDTDGISISFPDLPECLSCAFTKRQSYRMAKEALALALHGVKVCEVPAQNFPIKRFTSNMFYIRTIVIKIGIKDNCLYDKNVIVCSDTQAEGSSEITEESVFDDHKDADEKG